MFDFLPTELLVRTIPLSPQNSIGLSRYRHSAASAEFSANAEIAASLSAANNNCNQQFTNGTAIAIRQHMNRLIGQK
jgi:hypothetical protein